MDKFEHLRSGQFEYIRSCYGVPAERGRRVKVNGRPGVIKVDRGSYIGVLFDREIHIRNCHPTWRVEYGELENVVGG